MLNSIQDTLNVLNAAESIQLIINISCKTVKMYLRVHKPFPSKTLSPSEYCPTGRRSSESGGKVKVFNMSVSCLSLDTCRHPSAVERTNPTDQRLPIPVL